MMNYPTDLFIDIVENQSGVQFIRQEEEEGVKARIYQGVTGKMVIIDVSEEDFNKIVTIIHERLINERFRLFVRNGTVDDYIEGR